METTFSMLKSRVRLERDKGVSDLSKLLLSDDWRSKEFVERLKSGILALAEDEEHWESRQGGLLASCVILKESEEWWRACGAEFGNTLRTKAIELLHDDEARVRIQAGGCNTCLSVCLSVCQSVSLFVVLVFLLDYSATCYCL